MNGQILHAKYCFMPNKLGGCGIQTKVSDLFEYAAGEVSDQGLTEILKTFEAAYPYLKFIASATGIPDPFDKRVVEAYWLGNDLLTCIDKKLFFDWCHERYGKQVSPKVLKILAGKVPLGALPHHSFHVFNSYLRSGHFDRAVYYMNECKISEGRVKEINQGSIKVDYAPIILGLDGFTFGHIEEKAIFTKINDKSFVSGLQVGDYITFHWSWACERIPEVKAKRLKKITFDQLKLFNV